MRKALRTAGPLLPVFAHQVGCAAAEHPAPPALCADSAKADTGFQFRIVAAAGAECAVVSTSGLPASCAELRQYCDHAKWGARVAAACPATCRACPVAAPTPSFVGPPASPPAAPPYRPDAPTPPPAPPPVPPPDAATTSKVTME
eukprot:gene14726-21403_t